MDKSKVDTDSASSSIQCRSTTEKFITIKQSKYPVLPFVRMLDDESWLSGSELKTDNSTSEDEEVRGTFVGGTRTRIRSKGKKRISSIRKVMTFSSSSSTTSSTSTSYQRMTTSRSAGSKEDLDEELVAATSSLWTSSRSADGQAVQITDDLVEKQWRPKRGSISLLPGLIEQIEAP